MRNALAIARKELSIYFTTPWAYVVFTAMVGITAFFFVSQLQVFREAQTWARENGWSRVPADFKNLTDGVVIPLWNVVTVVTLFVSPILSMRLFSEEKNQKTFELLMTAPVRPIEIVVGKFLGGLGIIWATLGLTIFFPIILSIYGASESGQALEWSTVLLGYAGQLLWGATCLGLGMFISALTESQMLAAILTFVIGLLWLFLARAAEASEGAMRTFIGYLSFSQQMEGFYRGVLDLKAVCFFLSVILFSLLLTHRTVEAQRWT